MTTRETIEAAFARVSYPGDESLTKCRCADCTKIANHFRGTKWHEHSLEKLLQFPTAIYQFTPAALRYYLPAFMTNSLGQWEETCLLPFLIMRQFAPLPDGSKTQPTAEQLERWSMLSPEQRLALAAYLREYSRADNVLQREEVLRTVAFLEAPPAKA
jgi:hypothetical protein